MKILFYFGHPSQYLFLRETIRRLSLSKRHTITILIKTKDVLETLVANDGLAYTNILPQVRGKSRLSIFGSLLKRTVIMFPLILKKKPDLMIGTDATIAQLGQLLNINRITITEDDYEVVKLLGDLTYPFTQTILCPRVCNVGSWDNKKVGYEGYMKLAYLHPAIFKIEEEVFKKYSINLPFVFIRLSRLDAHHDFGINGIRRLLIKKIMDIAERTNFNVYISSEREVAPEYIPYLLDINPNDLHQVLVQASVLVCDSQSMTVEAAMLGIPSLRYSDFVGRISVLEELQHKYQLTDGIPTDKEDELISKLEGYLKDPNLRSVFKARKERMLSEKIDVTAFLVWFIQNYPESKKIMQNNPKFQDKFLSPLINNN